MNLFRWALMFSVGVPWRVGAQQRDAASVRGNVVRVVGVSGAGFGFIVGLDNRALLIATPWHVVKADADSTPNVCFLPEFGGCRRGRVIYVDDPVDAIDRGLDLAVVRVGYPAGLLWRPDVHGDPPRAGDAVLFIGRGGDWYIPPRSGKITGTDPTTGLLQYQGLPVAQGVSGAPVLVGGSIVAMHVSSAGALGQGIPIDDIGRRVRERLRAEYVLVKPRHCEEPGASSDDFRGVSVRLHFAWNRPARAMDAIARLQCWNVAALPIPEWQSPATEPGIVYPDGGLRLARIIQSAIVDVAVLDARLGSVPGVDIRMP